MTHRISIFSQLDTEAESRRALAKVYSLLLKLAEKSDNKDLLHANVAKEEIIEDAALIQLELSL